MTIRRADFGMTMLSLRISRDEKQSYEDASRLAGRDRSDWIRSVLNAVASRRDGENVTPAKEAADGHR